MAAGGSLYYDRQEVRDPQERETSIFHAVPGLLRHAIDNTGFYGRLLGGIEPDDVLSRTALAALPVTRKSDLLGHQRETPPFGGLTATPATRLARIFASPGPIFDPEGSRPDYWRFARAMFAAGFNAGELVYNTFSYHLTPAGFMVDSGARALGCPVVPGGTGQTELQIQIIRELAPSAYTGTPSFLRILLERARADGEPIACFSRALVAGEACPPELKDEFRRDHGIEVFEAYGTADLGMVAYESNARSGLIADEALILEIVRPGTGDPVASGDVGELLVTVFNPDYPLIRFATGDLTRMVDGPSRCGRTNMRIAGWMGRADQSTKVRGQFVHPGQVAEILRRHAGVDKARLVITSEAGGQDLMILRCEMASNDMDGVPMRIGESVRAVTGLRGTVEMVAPGTLPNDGVVIEDQRSH
ncbi:MAG: AMP-binding protein [Geminicoccaceae bacterium]|nr:AMP-binding protein [Geminicoccaceae bacterium]